MKNLLNTKNIYKLIVCIFIAFAIMKIRSQFVTLKSYNREIASLNSKIIVLKEQTESKDETQDAKKNTENMARKDLKMYYSNETPYKGY